jgi:hypothetical protein
MSSRRLYVFLGLNILPWLVVLVAGFAILWKYSNTPGAEAKAPPQWPADTSLRPSPRMNTLVLFLHPHCPCSQATVAELERIQANLRQPVNIYILLLHPSGKGPAWDDSSLARTVRSIPGTQVLTDLAGVEARRFGARTSGEIMLYDATGSLRFHGGITGARGHEGPSLGQDSLIQLLTRGQADQTAAPVYGCPLFESPE